MVISKLAGAFPKMVWFTLRTVLKRWVLVPNLVEEMNLRAWKKERSGDRVHGRIAPAFVVKVARRIKEVEIGKIKVRTEEVEVGDLKIGPNYIHSSKKIRVSDGLARGNTGSRLTMAKIVRLTVVIGYER